LRRPLDRNPQADLVAANRIVNSARECEAGLCHHGRMLFESDKVMFEIYRETEYTGRYRVVYFTELNDHNKESEINRALAGEHFYDGFIRNQRRDEAKGIIESILSRLNEGERVDPAEVKRVLGDCAA
jgi:hypothetical protein